MGCIAAPLALVLDEGHVLLLQHAPPQAVSLRRCHTTPCIQPQRELTLILELATRNLRVWGRGRVSSEGRREGQSVEVRASRGEGQLR